MTIIIDDEAYKHWNSIIQGISRTFSGRGMPRDDLVAEGFHGLLEAKERFDATKGCSFERFARRCVWSKMRDASEKWRSFSLTEEGELDMILFSQSSSCESIDPAIMHSLSDKEFRVVMCYFGFISGEKMTLREISEIMDLSVERIRQIKAGALEKMQNLVAS